MDGRNPAQVRAPRIGRGLNHLVVGLVSLSGLAGASTLADDSPALRALARRYSEPARVFAPVENGVAIDRVVVAKKAFATPPVAPGPVKPVVAKPPLAAKSIVDRRPTAAPPRVTPPSAALASAKILPPAPSPAAASAKTPPPAATKTRPDHRPTLFADAEPPAFVVTATAAVATPPLSAEPIPVEPPAHNAGPVTAVVPPAVSPSLMVAPPAVAARAIPDAPAFSPTAEPLTITIGAVTAADQPTPPPAPGSDASSSAAGQSGAPGSFGAVEKLGDAPQSNTLEFLRQQAILLKPGQCQFDWGLNYSVFDAHAALPTVDTHGNIVGVANERERLQLVSIPFALRYGICEGLQAYINAPLGWSNTETTTDNGDSITNNFVGLGDISAGVSYQIMKGCGAYVPDVIASLGFVAPTGHATFATSLLAPNSALGQGFWDITGQLLAVHTIDPVVIFYGAGYVHRFDASFGNNLEVDPGQEFDYLFGVGFAVNPWVTISGSFIGNYLTRFGVNDVSIPGSDLDLIRFRVSVTVVKDKRICEPFGEIGMTPDSPSRVGITFTY